MPGQMPPQGAPPDQSAGPGAPPSTQGQSAGGAISTLLMNVDKALDHLNVVIGQSKVTSPEEKAIIGQINQAYGHLMDMLGVQGGHDEDGAGAPDGGAQGQTVPPEAAGNKGAVPSPM